MDLILDPLPHLHMNNVTTSVCQRIQTEPQRINSRLNH